jgi:hypothetical protein
MRALSSPLYLYDSLTKQKSKLFRSILIFNQTKKWSDYVLFAKYRIERLYSQKMKWSRSILVDSPTKRTLSIVGLHAEKYEEVLEFRIYGSDGFLLS